VFGAITGAEVFVVYSPSCLLRNADSSTQALVQLASSMFLPCLVVLTAMLMWSARYGRRRAAV
jgi:hypothetical protein